MMLGMMWCLFNLNPLLHIRNIRSVDQHHSVVCGICVGCWSDWDAMRCDATRSRGYWTSYLVPGQLLSTANTRWFCRWRKPEERKKRKNRGNSSSSNSSNSNGSNGNKVDWIVFRFTSFGAFDLLASRFDRLKLLKTDRCQCHDRRMELAISLILR